MPDAPLNNEQLLEQLIELQSQFAFQEELLRELDDVVTRQQTQIDAMERELRLHRDKLIDVLENLPEKEGAAASQDERPPHY